MNVLRRGYKNERKINWISWKRLYQNWYPLLKQETLLGVYYKVKEGTKREHIFEGVVIRVNVRSFKTLSSEKFLPCVELERIIM